MGAALRLPAYDMPLPAANLGLGGRVQIIMQSQQCGRRES